MTSFVPPGEVESLAGDQLPCNALGGMSLGVLWFGMIVWEVRPGDGFRELDESGCDQVVVFLVVSGDGRMVMEGGDHPARAGTFTRLAPEPRRTVVT